MYVQKEARLKELEAKAASINVASEDAMNTYVKLRQGWPGGLPQYVP